MSNDPDAIWKPGYDGPAPIVTARRAPFGECSVEEPGPAADAPTPATRSRLAQFTIIGTIIGIGMGIGITLALALFAALIVRDQRVAESPDPSVFGGADARRLPIDAAPLWSVDIPSDGDHWVEVVRRDLVIAAVASPSAPASGTSPPSAPESTSVVALDALTGAPRWTLLFDAGPRDVSVLGAVDDVVVIEQPGEVGPIVTGVDLATGETIWSTDTAANVGHVGLVGTPFVARLPTLPDRLVTLIDATSGRDVGSIISDPTADGRPGGWSTTGAGMWHLVDGAVVIEYDLRVALGDATVVGRVDDVSTPWLLLDDQLAVVDDDGSITFRNADGSRPVTTPPEVRGAVRSLTPVSQSAFVVSAPGSITGVGIVGDVLDVVWSRRDGLVMDHHPVGDRSIIQLATQGGAAVQLVDGLTGETIEQLTMLPGALQALVVAADGALVLRTSATGTRLAGIDFDGTERWSILGSEPLMIGDRIAVRATSGAEATTPPARQLRISAYGDVE